MRLALCRPILVALSAVLPGGAMLAVVGPRQAFAAPARQSPETEEPARQDPVAKPEPEAPRERLVLRGEKPPSATTASGEYGGVTPGLPAMPTIRLPRDAATRCYLTWTGFQLQPTGSRLFLQLNRSPTRTLHVTPGEIRLELGDCRVAHTNNLRPLDLRFFDTPLGVARVRWSRRGGTALHIALRRPAQPTVQELKLQGWTYLFVTFQHGRTKPAATLAPRRPESPSRPAPPPSRGPEAP